jgi:hypothetical protein
MRVAADIVLTGGAAMTVFARLGYIRIGLPAVSTAANTPDITDWMQAWGSVITAATSVILLVGLLLTWQQLRNSHHWNKMNATFTYFQTTEYLRLDKCAAEELRKVGVELHTIKHPLSSQEVDAIWHSITAFSCLKDLLNFLEDFAAAVAADAIDDATAYRMMSSIVIRYGDVFSPFFTRRRTELDDKDVHIELERLAMNWKARRTAPA